ncbi:MAG: OpgC domain-containing protein, partial [Reyranella sp.]|nr:OpgC domain-containing protein [Reyranella sp.]
MTAAARDIRLDLFRGLALWFIFLDHIPTNVVSWLTVRNYGFSDATEIFVFISGYTAVIAYSRMMQREGWPRAASRIYRRVWQLYVAHILLFVAFSAQIAWVSIARDMPALIEEMELLGLGENPYRAILEAALLKFRPVNLDVLPLYIVLLAAFPFVLPLVVRWPLWVIGLSLALYAATCRFNWNMAAYPEGKVWYFNPMAWQVVFHVGAACAVLGDRLAWLDRFRWLLTVLAVVFLLFSAFIALSWHYNPLERLVPHWVSRQLYPIDKTNIDILRFLHFLAVAWMVRLLVPIDAAALKWRGWEAPCRWGERPPLLFLYGAHPALTG